MSDRNKHLESTEAAIHGANGVSPLRVDTNAGHTSPTQCSTTARQPSKSGKVLFVGSGKGWHARGIVRALNARGIKPVIAPLNRCRFNTENKTGLDIPGLGDTDPDAVFVRMVPGGTFEEVTFFLGILHALEARNIPVWNGARAIERCTDKSIATFLMSQAGLQTPATWCGSDLNEARTYVEKALQNGRLLVQKPLFGSQGRGLKLIRSLQDLAAPEDINGIYYLQDFVGTDNDAAKDWRLFVCQGEVIATMIRHGKGWITNMRQGGRAEAAIPCDTLKSIATTAVDAVGAKYAGVDIVQDAEGNWLVLEVNSMPAWSALGRVSKVPIAARVADAFLLETLGIEPLPLALS